MRQRDDITEAETTGLLQLSPTRARRQAGPNHVPNDVRRALAVSCGLCGGWLGVEHATHNKFGRKSTETTFQSYCFNGLERGPKNALQHHVGTQCKHKHLGKTHEEDSLRGFSLDFLHLPACLDVSGATKHSSHADNLPPPPPKNARGRLTARKNETCYHKNLQSISFSFFFISLII